MRRPSPSLPETEAPKVFDGGGPLWTPLLNNIQRYAEWGMGMSTEVALAETACTVRSVETSEEWFQRTAQAHHQEPRLSGILVDLGAVSGWGRPVAYRRRSRIDEYLLGPFSDSYSPELVLIDGRFRVACFAAALLNGPVGMLILFDDYVGREHYHVVEELLQPIAVAGRQALFVRPETIDIEAVSQMLVDFRHVMD